MEENTLAILDTSGFNRSKDSHHLCDDRIAFLEAVRSASLVPENGNAPTNKMFEAIFHILKDEDSLELVMGSYQLLSDLDKSFPRVYLSNMEAAATSESSDSPLELVVVEEAWSPFNLGLDSDKEEANKSSGGSLNPLVFHSLIQDLAEVANKKSEPTEIKAFRDMLLLQYLVNILESDFLPRRQVLKAKRTWNVLRESLLNTLLGSRKIVYKGFIKDCMYILCCMSQNQKEITDDLTRSESSLESGDTAVAFGVPEVEKTMLNSLKKFLYMIVELDSSRAVADQEGLTTRADGVRTPIMDIIMDELSYNKDVLSPFLEVFDEPKLKLKMIVQYFQKYTPKSSVRTRRSSNPESDATFEGILKCLSSGNSAKSVIKKISAEITQLLLAHSFQAYLSLTNSTRSEEDSTDNSLVETCKAVISAFTCLRKEDKRTEILPIGKEALFTAAAILSAQP